MDYLQSYDSDCETDSSDLINNSSCTNPQQVVATESGGSELTSILRDLDFKPFLQNWAANMTGRVAAYAFIPLSPLSSAVKLIRSAVNLGLGSLPRSVKDKYDWTELSSYRGPSKYHISLTRCLQGTLSQIRGFQECLRHGIPRLAISEELSAFNEEEIEREKKLSRILGGTGDELQMKPTIKLSFLPQLDIHTNFEHSKLFLAATVALDENSLDRDLFCRFDELTTSAAKTAGLEGSPLTGEIPHMTICIGSPVSDDFMGLREDLQEMKQVLQARSPMPELIDLNLHIDKICVKCLEQRSTSDEAFPLTIPRPSIT